MLRQLYLQVKVNLNIKVFINTIMNSNPKLQKIQHFKSIAVSSTMGPGIKLDKGQFRIGQKDVN